MAQNYNPQQRGRSRVITSTKASKSPSKVQYTNGKTTQEGSIVLSKLHNGKDCKREWVKNPITGKWIEVNGKTWFELYKTHRKELEASARKTTYGTLRNGICVVPPGDPPHVSAGGSRGSGGTTRPSGMGANPSGRTPSFTGGFIPSSRGTSPGRGTSPSREHRIDNFIWGHRGDRDGDRDRGRSRRWSWGISPHINLGFGVPSYVYPPYDDYWWGPPCYGDRECWADYYGYDYDDLYWL